MAEKSAIHRKSQQKWLEDILKTNSNKWTVVVFHYPVFSAKSSQENLNVRRRFKPLFDKYKVDLVFQGHDHTYARGMEKILMDKEGIQSGDKTLDGYRYDLYAIEPVNNHQRR